MTTIEIFNVCTHSKDGGGGLSMGIPTPCSIATHPTNGNRFVTGGGDANVFIWHISSVFECGLEQIAKLTYHTNGVNAVSWNSNGDQLATSGDDKMIAIWKKDERYDYNDPNNQAGFGETMIFKEKWLPSIKMRGPISEVSEIKWLHSDETIIVASLDGSIGFYDIKKQEKVHTIAMDCDFLQGIAIDCSLNLLAAQSTKASVPIFKIIKHEKHEKKRYRSIRHCLLQHFPLNKSEVQQQKLYNEEYAEEKKKIENTNTETKGAIKPKKKNVSRCSLFKNNVITTTKKPCWSPDGLLLCLVTAQSKDKVDNAVHILHRSNLKEKITTILLCESCHATVARFNPMKFKLNGEIEKGCIVERYNMKYRMILAVICGSELFLFDTARNNAVLYWKDQDTQNLFDLEWSCDGKALLVSDIEGFITRVSLNDDDMDIL